VRAAPSLHCARSDGTAHAVAWERTEADLDAQRDPLYDSDTEYDPTQPEARPIAGTTPWSAKELTARLHPGYICRGPDGEPGRCRFAPPPGRRTATSEAEMEPSTSVNGRRSTSRSPVKSEVVDGMAMYTVRGVCRPPSRRSRSGMEQGP
jgi:hypothetical protein